MLIDWFTVGAQALNFLILVWLLKRFLYQPVLRTIDAREQRIATELADAAATRAAAQKDRDELRGKSAAFDEQRTALLHQATDQAAAERERLLGEARRQAEAARAGQASALRSERLRLGQRLGGLVATEVFGIARQALADLATASLEERLAGVFMQRLRQMDGAARQTLAAALKASSGPAVVRSSFELPAPQKAAIQDALHECFATQTPVRFEIAADVLCGIELAADGQKISWSLADYLHSLEQKFAALVDADAAAAAAAAPAEAAAAPAAHDSAPAAAAAGPAPA